MRAFSTLLLAAVLAAGAPAVARAQDKPDDAKPSDSKPSDSKPADPKPSDDKPETPAPEHRGQRGGRRQRPSMADRLKEPLGLSDDQVKKIKQIEADAFAEAKKARESGQAQPTDRDARRKQRKEMIEKLRQQIRDVLTDAQKQKYDDFLKKQEEQRKNRQGRRGPRGGDKPEGDDGAKPDGQKPDAPKPD